MQYLSCPPALSRAIFSIEAAASCQITCFGPQLSEKKHTTVTRVYKLNDHRQGEVGDPVKIDSNQARSKKTSRGLPHAQEKYGRQ
jgi:hypothetical protein